MKILKIDHVGIAVRALDEIDPALRELLAGAGRPHEETVADQGVRTTSYEAGESGLEFLETLEVGEGPVGRYLEKRGPGIHHVCLRVDDLEETLAHLKARGVALIDETPRRGAGGCRIAFIHPKSAGGILIELSAPAS